MILDRIVDLEEEITEDDHYARGLIHGVLFVPTVTLLSAGAPLYAVPFTAGALGCEYVWWRSRLHNVEDSSGFLPGFMED